MPHMSGQEVWRHLQAMNLRRAPRVLFVTGDIATKGGEHVPHGAGEVD
jgi:CheY-like chemotaxis protein